MVHDRSSRRRCAVVFGAWLGLWVVALIGPVVELHNRGIRRFGVGSTILTFCDQSGPDPIVWTREDHWFFSEFDVLDEGGAPARPERRTVPAWLGDRRRGDSVGGLAFGWPARAFAVRSISRQAPRPDASGLRPVTLSPSPDIWSPEWKDLPYIGHLLPNQVLWSGVLINGLTYAALIALVVFTLRRLRLAMFRRRAKVPCPQCGYELHGLGPQAPCPECGAAAPAAPAPAAQSG